MLLSEVYGMMAIAHARSVQASMRRIEGTDWTAEEKARQIANMCAVAHEEWRDHGWQRVLKYIQEAEQIAKGFCEFSPTARKPKVSPYQQVNGRVDA